MKSILLTTTALVAFAGAAAADGHTGVSFSGGATLGYNTDDAGTGDNDGFYWSADADVTMSAALDNGVTASATWGFDIVDNDAFSNGTDIDADDFLITIESEMASLYFGDTNSSADTHWSGVDGATVADFNGKTEHAGLFDAVLRGEATFGGVTGSLSYGVDANDSTTPLDAMQVAAVADLSGYTVVGAYQGDINDDGSSIMGVSVAGAVAGVDVMASYLAEDSTAGASSLGVSASMPFGPVTVGGYYSMNSSDVDAADALDAYGLDVSYTDGPITVSADYDMIEDASEGTWEIDGSYDTGMSIVVYAGMNSDEAFYVGGTYDLGGGAELLVSYASDDNGSSDEIGDPEYQEGTTVEVSFSF